MKRILISILLGITIVYAFFSIPAGIRILKKSNQFIALANDQQTQAQIGEYYALITQIRKHVGPNESILFNIRMQVQPLFVERILAYWLYPTTVYSTVVLNAKNISIPNFIKDNKVDWYYNGRQLNFVGSYSRTDKELYRPLNLSISLWHWIAILFGLIYLTIVGFLFLKLFPLMEGLLHPPIMIATSFCCGSGIVSIWILLCFFMGIHISYLTVSIPLNLFIIVYLFKGSLNIDPKRFLNVVKSCVNTSGLNIAFGLCAAVLMILMIYITIGTPMFGYDDRYQWAHKAHIILEENSFWDSELLDPNTVHFHPQYPLLVPAMEASLFVFTGTLNNQFVKILFPLFWGSMVLSVGYFLFQSGKKYWQLPTLLLMEIPYYWGYRNNFDLGAAFQAYPDLIVSTFITFTLVFFLSAIKRNNIGFMVISAFCLLCSSLAKSEGKIYCLVFVILALPLLLWSQHKNKRFVVQSIGLIGGASFVYAIYYIFIIKNTPHGILPDNYSELLTLNTLLENRSRFSEIVTMFIKDLFISPRFGFVGFCLAVSLIIGIRKIKKFEIYFPLAFCALMICAFHIPYIVLAENEWRAIYSWSAGRLMSQLLPLFFLSIGLLILPDKNKTIDFI